MEYKYEKVQSTYRGEVYPVIKKSAISSSSRVGNEYDSRERERKRERRVSGELARASRKVQEEFFPGMILWKRQLT